MADYDFPELPDDGSVTVDEHVMVGIFTRIVGGVVKELAASGIDITDGLASRLRRRYPEDEGDASAQSVQFFAEVFAAGILRGRDGTQTK